MDEGGRFGSVSLSIDRLLAVIQSILGFFRPVADALGEIAARSWLGAAVIFSIFFAVFLIRAGARSGVHNMGTFAGAMEHYASWGLLASAGFLALLGLEWVFMPVWSVLLSSLVNSVTGAEPGFLQMVAFLASSTPEKMAFIRDMAAFYGEGHTVLPLGFRGAFMVLVAFGTMWLVARGMGRLRSSV